MSDNELIEKFWIEQGGKPHPSPDLWFYESDWNMLMPVVEKINTMEPSEFNYHVDRMTQFRIGQAKIQMLSITSPMRIVYSAVVDFIKWYNQNKHQ